MKGNVILELSLDFSVSVIEFCEVLDAQKRFVIAKQLLRSGTSIGANIFEAQHAESMLDFIHKMKVAVKEANETLYWLTLCERTRSYPSSPELKSEVERIITILSKIIITSRSKISKR